MPQLIKFVKNLDEELNGYDPTVPYQMIPQGGARKVTVQTGETKAELQFTIPDVARMSNFQILQQNQPSTFPLPSAGVSVRRIALPERSLIKFAVTGQARGITVLEGRDRTTDSRPSSPATLQMGISVKTHRIQKFVICYVYDRIQRDNGLRIGFGSHFAAIHKAYFNQANISINNVDGHVASTERARAITLNGSWGRSFNILDRALLARLLGSFDKKYPGVSADHTVVFSIPTPLRVGNFKQYHPQGYSFRATRRTGHPYNVLFMSNPNQRERIGLRQALAHEIGHSLGLDHNPEKAPPKLPNNKPNPEWLKPQNHTVMFPTIVVRSFRLSASQIELLHLFGPNYPEEIL